MSIDELEQLVDKACNDLQAEWENNAPETISGKIKWCANNHYLHLWADLADYRDSQGYDHIRDVDIIDASQPYIDTYRTLLDHVMTQYAAKRNNQNR